MSQRVESRRVLGDGWTEFEVLTSSSAGLDSRTNVRTRNDALFVDFSIEEFTGISRRAKHTSVRLEEEAARRLYAALSVKFGTASDVAERPGEI